MRDEPLVLAVTVVVPLLLGYGLRWRGAVVACLALGVYAVARGLADGAGDEELLGAWVLGTAGGLALGWAGALLRRERRRSRLLRTLPGPRRG